MSNLKSDMLNIKKQLLEEHTKRLRDITQKAIENSRLLFELVIQSFQNQLHSNLNINVCEATIWGLDDAFADFYRLSIKEFSDEINGFGCICHELDIVSRAELEKLCAENNVNFTIGHFREGQIEFNFKLVLSEDLTDSGLQLQ